MLCFLIFSFLLAVVGYFGYKKLKEKVPEIIAGMIETSAEGVFVQIKLPEAERKAAMDTIKDFTRDIRDGKVDFQQGKRIAKALGDKALMGAILTRSFETQYVCSAYLGDAEKRSAHVTLTRFVHGVIDDKISKETLDAILNMMSEEQGNKKNGKNRLKNSISVEELRDILLKMKGAADKAGIENREYKIDIRTIIREAIEKGMRENRDAQYTSKDSCFDIKNIRLAC